MLPSESPNMLIKTGNLEFQRDNMEILVNLRHVFVICF